MNTPEAPERDDEDDDKPDRRLDEELKAMGRAVRILDSLNQNARIRAARWLADRYLAPPF